MEGEDSPSKDSPTLFIKGENFVPPTEGKKDNFSQTARPQGIHAEEPVCPTHGPDDQESSRLCNPLGPELLETFPRPQLAPRFWEGFRAMVT